MKRLAIRSARKAANVSGKVFYKSLKFSNRVENKATRILDGIDYSVGVEKVIPLEKIYYNTLKHITPINPALPKVGQQPSIVLFLPSLNNRSFYGGTATALIVAAMAANIKNMPLHIVQTLETGHAKDLSSFFKKEGITIDESRISITSVAGRAYNVYGYLPMHPEDIFIASAWWDAHLISKLPLTKKFIYLIQDFEPIFYNNSDLYVRAEQTYSMPNFVPLCNTQLMYTFMQNKGYAPFKSNKIHWFEPAVNRSASGFVTKKNSNQKRRLFLYGRPDVHRNLFLTGLSSIDDAFLSGKLSAKDWEVVMAGQDKIPAIRLSSGVQVTNLGKMSMDDYVTFSKSVDVAVSLMMAPHPNYPTLEFASIGAAVVTTKYADKQNLNTYSGNIITSDINIDSISDSILKASNMSYDDRIKAAKSSTIPTSWDRALNETLQKVLISI